MIAAAASIRAAYGRRWPWRWRFTYFRSGYRARGLPPVLTNTQEIEA